MLANFDISAKPAATDKKKDRRDKYKMSKKKANPGSRPARDVSVQPV